MQDEHAMLAVIHRLNSSLNADSCLKIYNAFIAPRVNYCLLVWGNCLQPASTEIDRSLERAVHLIFVSSNLTLQPSTASMASFHPFHQLVLIRNVNSLFKIVCDNMANYYLDCTQISHSSGLSTSCTDGRKFYILAHIRSCGEKFFRHSAKQDWNALPASTNAQFSFSTF